MVASVGTLRPPNSFTIFSFGCRPATLSDRHAAYVPGMYPPHHSRLRCITEFFLLSHLCIMTSLHACQPLSGLDSFRFRQKNRGRRAMALAVSHTCM